MKFLSIFFLVSVASYCQISPSKPIVAVGQSLTITASSNITCPSVGYVGSFSGCGTTSVIYTAPSSLAPQKVAQGCMIAPNDSVFFTPVNNLPVLSSAYITNFVDGSSINLSVEYAWGLGLATSSTFTYTPSTFYNNGSVTYSSYPDIQYSPFYSMTENSSFDGISGYSGNNQDHHSVLINSSSCHIYETYDQYLNGTKGTCNGCTAGTYTANVESAQDYLWSSYSLISQVNVDAAGLLLAPITLTGEELEQAVASSPVPIHHMLRITGCGGCFNYSTFQWPATANGASGASCSTNCFPYGGVFHIKNSQLSSLKTSVCGTNTKCQALLQAMNTYGFIIADIGINGQIEIAPDVSLDPTNVTAINLLSNLAINTTNFEGVNISALEQSSTSYSSCPLNQSCVNGTQSYVTPPGQTWVSVGGIIYPIVVQSMSVSLGNNYPYYIPVVAGTGAITIPTYIHGYAGNLGVTWSLVSGVGSVTSGGVYTPPSTISSPTLTVLQATSSYDSASYYLMTLNVIPASSPNIIQDDTNSSSNTTDFYGNTWLADLGVENNYYSQNVSGYSTNQTPYANQFNSGMLYIGGFLRKYYFLPNGNYLVNFLIGQNQCSPAWSCGSWPGVYESLLNYSPISVEVNGNIQLHQYDWSKQTSYFFSQGNIVSVPATVSNNFLEIGLYKTAPDLTINSFTNFLCSGCQNVNYAPPSQNTQMPLNGVFISSDSTSPYLGIDVSNFNSKISAGSNFEVWPIDGHIGLPTGSGSVAWSLVSPYPSGTTITANQFDNGAIISLPSGSYRNSDVIIVKASYGSYSVQKAISITGGTNPLMQLH